MSASLSPWTEQALEVLKQKHSEGLSAAEIANAIGTVSRNAVLGKIHRLGLSAPRIKQLSKLEEARRDRIKRRAPWLPLPSNLPPRLQTPVAEEVQPVEPPIALPLSVSPVTLTQLNDTHCRAVVGDDRYCGDACGVNFVGQRSPYCQPHHRMYYMPPSKPQRKLERVARVVA
jgi:GcrA cell cycle regulator